MIRDDDSIEVTSAPSLVQVVVRTALAQAPLDVASNPLCFRIDVTNPRSCRAQRPTKIGAKKSQAQAESDLPRGHREMQRREILDPPPSRDAPSNVGAVEIHDEHFPARLVLRPDENMIGVEIAVIDTARVHPPEKIGNTLDQVVIELARGHHVFETSRRWERERHDERGRGPRPFAERNARRRGYSEFAKTLDDAPFPFGRRGKCDAAVESRQETSI